MPRPNVNRSVYAELHLAARIASERERRGWTYEYLASQMTESGCKIDPSAIYKIERGKPQPRRITVDELVAFSRVFDLRIDDLLAEPSSEAKNQVAPLLDEWSRCSRATLLLLGTASERFDRVGKDIHDMAEASPLAAQGFSDWLVDHDGLQELDQVSAALETCARAIYESRALREKLQNLGDH